MKEPFDNLETFVFSNRDDFDFLDPNPGIWEKVSKSKQTFRIKGMLWKVAAILLVLLVYPFYTLVINNNPGNKSLRSNNLIISKIPELLEADAYYTAYINNQMHGLQLQLIDKPDIKTELDKDINDLDEIYNELIEDLKDNIDNKEVVDALIQNYRMKVKILEELFDYISIDDINETPQNEL